MDPFNEKGPPAHSPPSPLLRTYHASFLGRSLSRHSKNQPAEDAEGRARRPSLKERFVSAQEQEGIPCPPEALRSQDDEAVSDTDGLPLSDSPTPQDFDPDVAIEPPASPGDGDTYPMHARRLSLVERVLFGDDQQQSDGPVRRLSWKERLSSRSRNASPNDDGNEKVDPDRQRRPSMKERFISSQSQAGLPCPPTSLDVPASQTEPASSDEPSRPESPSPDVAIEPPRSRIKTYHPLAPEVLILLMPGSVLGVLARLGLVALNTYAGESAFPLAWVQGIGCVCMGMIVGYRDQITSFHPPLYTALATGFCGSLTTFSSWMLDVFLAFSNASHYDRLWIYTVMDGLSRTLLTFAVALCGLSLGLHIASWSLPRWSFLTSHRLAHASPSFRIFLVALSFTIYILTIPMYFVLSPRYRPLATSALLFSFPGTLLRHVLGTQLNGRHPYWPVGTFFANALATALLAAFHALQRVPSSPVSITSCVILQGLIDGLCGCLSTVSTFAVEVRGMQGKGRDGRRAWFYGLGSWAAGQVLMVAILGGAMWGGHVGEGNLCTA